MSTGPDGVFMLGMHRSGTSAATRVINLLGVATCAPEDMPRGPWNPTGLWESKTLNGYDDELLAAMGRSWIWPPPAGAAYDELDARIANRREDARRVFDEVHPQRPWVWKDPRACLLLPFWRAALGGSKVAVLVVRNPLEVADSLRRRHDVDLEYGLALWERYNRLVLAHAAGLPALVSRYEELIEDPAGWSEVARSFLLGAGVELAPAGGEGGAADFIEEGRRHNVRSRGELAAASPSALHVADALDSLAGAHASLSPPELDPEPAGVEAAIARVASRGGLSWNDPPWAGADAERASPLRRAGRAVRNAVKGGG